MKNDNNKKNKALWINIFIYNLIWIIYYVFEMLNGRMTTSYLKMMNLIFPMIFFTLWSLGIYMAFLKCKNQMSRAKLFSAIFIFVIIDQGIKGVIRNYLPLKQHIRLLSDWLYFYPIVNTKGSWAASRFGLDIGINKYIILNVVFLPIIIYAYRFYLRNYRESLFLNVSFILIFSGAVCSLIDKMFFGGSLDYMLIKDIFVADLKDFYITLGSGSLMVEMLLDYINNFN